MSSTGRVTLGLVLGTAACWTFVPALQMLAGAVVIAGSPRRRVAMPRALDLLFMGHLSWSFWLLGVAAVIGSTPAPFAGRGALMLSALVPIAWTAPIVSAFCRTVLQTTAREARLRTAAHQAIVWTIAGICIERPIDALQPAAEAIQAVHAQGGVAIAAHPVRAYWKAFDDRALALLDGVEAAHPEMHAGDEARSDLEMFYRRARARNADVAAIGSSDFHAIAPVGLCRTYVFARGYSEQGVLDAVRHGRTVAVDGRGNLYGDPLLVRLVERQRGRADRIAPQRNSPLRWFALACAWLGLLGAMILRGGATSG